ncbi:MAG: nucleotide exchange factor GrpE [bacterium]|nr:nucleotide exchange factor GrpE [bacterium]
MNDNNINLDTIEDNQEAKTDSTEQATTAADQEAAAEDRGEAVIEAAKNMKRKNPVDEQQDAKIAELINDLQRTRADFENFRRQNDIQREQDRNYAKLDTVKKILPLIDDFERAIQAQPKVLSPLSKNFEKTLKSIGLQKIDSAVGTEFNPDLHEAISVDGDGDKETIAETLRAGYYYGDEVLRTAMVRVLKS